MLYVVGRAGVSENCWVVGLNRPGILSNPEMPAPPLRSEHSRHLTVLLSCLITEGSAFKNVTFNILLSHGASTWLKWRHLPVHDYHKAQGKAAPCRKQNTP
jgi:hypothetical protein